MKRRIRRENKNFDEVSTLRVFLAGHSVAMVTYWVTKIIPTCPAVIGQFFDTMIVVLFDRVVIMTYQNLSLGKCWKLFWATLNACDDH